MDFRVLLLYVLSSLAGLTMVVGGIWLIYKEKIYVDRESKQPIEVSTPVGSFKSNYPALALFALGFFPLVYPLTRVPLECLQAEDAEVTGSIAGIGHEVAVYAVIGEDNIRGKRKLALPIKFFPPDHEKYKVLLVVNGHVVDESFAERRNEKNGMVEVAFAEVETDHSPYEPDEGTIVPVPKDYLPSSR
jgi:hypothetical protein